MGPLATALRYYITMCCDVFSGVVEGFAVSPVAKTSLLWSIVLPPKTDAILGTALPAQHEHIYSYAKASSLQLD